jgi:ATP-dependent helicase Lhr and Lhr-like helicase
MPIQAFHPAVRTWFENTFNAATEVQQQAWPAIGKGQHTLLAAPTGSGKTLAAFLAVIDNLVKEGLEQGLSDSTRVLYISPLKALSNDIQCNLQEPLQGIREQLSLQGLPDIEIRAWVRTGDTSQAERQKAKRTPPHILVTTPESAYILLTSESGRQMLSTVTTVIVDEIHALAGNKRGAHLTLSLERLQALSNSPVKRVGLSATQKPIAEMARFLVGNRPDHCAIIDTGHVRERDLALEIPDSPLQAIMSNEVWEEIYEKLEALIRAHRSTLIFVNTRRLAERAARFLAQRLGTENVMSHHGSMAKEKRLAAEQQLKCGTLQCLVATSSLELGIDIGAVDLVCQLGSPRSIAIFLQRIGRSGHAVGAIPKGRLFPLSRDELVESVALLNAAENSELDCVIIPDKPLDILAQQIVAEVANLEWHVDDLYAVFKLAWPYRDLQKQQYHDVVKMLAQGFSTRRGRRSAHIHHDPVSGMLRARQGTRLLALTNGGAIPDQFDYEVVLSPEGMRIGTLNEDFAFESLPGDIFQLGNNSYRIIKIEPGKVFVADASGEPPNIPFWFGEAPGRTDELSLAVSNLRTKMNDRLQGGISATEHWLINTFHIPTAAAEQLTAYLAATRAALGIVPTQENLILERFLDEIGDMHLVLHSPYGSRINRAWGLALRKRFCRKFNFELQAAASEDSIILSLSATHSFPLSEVIAYLNSRTVKEVLIQALLTVPMFATRWRWNATIALAVRRFSHGKRSPPYFQRADAEDLVAIIFPDQLACQENINGNREIPDHPLVMQTLADCLNVTMDCAGLVKILTALERGNIQILCKDLAGPSPLSQEIINARPYAFLDDAPAEERRTMAIRSRSNLNPEDAAELARLDPAAISKVCDEAWPLARNADELYDALVLLGFVSATEVQQSANKHPLNTDWQALFSELKKQSRATVLTTPEGNKLWLAIERLGEFLILFPDASIKPKLVALKPADLSASRSTALREIIRSRLQCLGPVSTAQLAKPLGVTDDCINTTLLALEQEGFVIRGQFDSLESGSEQWCERHLLARIQRYTLKQLRSEIEPVSAVDFMRFLFYWQGLTDKKEGQQGLAAVLNQLEGFSVAAAAWEAEILAARINHYTSDMLDYQCSSGKFAWIRLVVTAIQEQIKMPPLTNSPIALVNRQHIHHWRKLSPVMDLAEHNLSGNAQKVLNAIKASGALFFVDLLQQTGLLKCYLENALGELVNWGMVTSDHFSGLRALISPHHRHPRSVRRRRRPIQSPFDSAGRWSLLQQSTDKKLDDVELEFLALVFLQRYGVVYKKLLERELIVPPWRDLLQIYWRMEARGEIRGGRFVQGVAGEQFALPNALATLRSIRRNNSDGNFLVISASDPLNLLGILLPGERLAAHPKNRIVFCDGLPLAVYCSKQIRFLAEVDETTASKTEKYLIRGRISG